MTTKFELMTTTYRKSGKWVLSLSIFEKNILSYDCSCRNQNENTLTLQVLDEFVFFYPKMKFFDNNNRNLLR